MEILSSRVIIHPVDFAASRRFYEDVLGLRLYHEYSDGEAVIGAVYFAGGGHIELVAHDDERGQRYKLWLQVPDLDTEQARLRDLDVEIEHAAEHKPWGLIELVLRDPDGHRITLVEVPEDHYLRRGP